MNSIKANGRTLIKLREDGSFSQDEFTKKVQMVSGGSESSSKLTESSKNFSDDDVLLQAQRLKEMLSESGQAMSDIKTVDNVIKKLKENGSDKKFKVWKLPVSRYGNENNNGRIYNRDLWENVKTNQEDAWKGICGLMDHPDDDAGPGSARDQAIVWHNIEISPDGIVYGYGTFVGPYGQLAQEIIEAGGRVGFSSSGFGEIDPYTRVVNPDTFMIERLADVVLNPSQSVYGSLTCPSDFMANPTEGATINYTESGTIKESSKSAILNTKGINTMNNNQVDAALAQGTPAPVASPLSVKESLSKAEEKSFRKHIKTFLSDVDTLDNPIDRLNECNEILSFFDSGVCPDLKESVEEAIKKEQTRLETLVEKSLEIQKNYNLEDISKLEENARKIAEQGLLLNEQVTDYKILCEALQKRNRELITENKKINSALKLSESIKMRESVQNTKKIAETIQDVEKMKESNDKLLSKNLRLMDNIANLNEGNKALEKECGRTETKLNRATALLSEIKEKSLSTSMSLRKASSENKQLQEENKKLSSVRKQLIEENECLEKDVNKLSKEVDALSQEKQDMKVDLQEALKESRNLKYKLERAEKQVDRLNENYSNKTHDVKEYEKVIKSLSEALEIEKEKNLEVNDKLVETTGKLTESGILYETMLSDYVKLEAALKNMKETSTTVEKTGRVKEAERKELSKVSVDKISRYVNLKENKGSDVNEYWLDLLEQYGENITPYEDEIRGCKTLREATQAFLKNRSKIDENFSIGSPIESFDLRRQGKSIKESSAVTHENRFEPAAAVEEKTSDFLKRASQFGMI